MHANEPGPEREFRAEDAELFLKISARIADSSGEVRDSYRELFGPVGKYSTCLNQLTRLLEYLLPRHRPGIRAPSRVGLELFFCKEPGRGYALTPFGELLQKRLALLPEFLTDLRTLAAAALDATLVRRVVRVGVPQTLGLRLLANVFSDPAALQDNGPDAAPLELELRFGNTKTDLIPRLRVGLLDFLVAYGLREEDGYSGKDGYFDPDVAQDVYFQPIGLDVPMVLLAHPSARIPYRDGQRITTGEPDHGGSHAPAEGRERRPRIDLREIDWRRVTLVTVPSWRQPRSLQEVMDAAGRVGRLLEVSQYDDALAVARTNGGVAVVSELFAARTRVRVFDLERTNEYTRPIGIYYNADRGLSPDACRFAEFLKLYVKAYRDCLREKPPALDTPGFRDTVGFDPNRPWEEIADRTRRARSEARGGRG